MFEVFGLDTSDHLSSFSPTGGKRDVGVILIEAILLK